ncbi:hypothetical protein NMG60_11033268 [Bertholletia excelsa]
MEASREEFTGSNDQSVIARGKRTKRQRPYSPVSSAGAGCGDGVCSSIRSPASSGEVSVSTEEDEDMANCLILLAQGGQRAVEEDTVKVEKSGGTRLAEATATTTGKSGFYVYECKTCNRSFPSFQALGGHRASHKKPKTEENRAVTATKPAIEDEQEEQNEAEIEQFAKISLPLSLQFAAKSNSSPSNNKAKVHECSICGSEFSSGQALGGHMRRHRPPANAPTAISGKEEADKPRNILALDLNLPAPPEDDHQRDSNFPFVFSGPALVDCHY